VGVFSLGAIIVLQPEKGVKAKPRWGGRAGLDSLLRLKNRALREKTEIIINPVSERNRGPRRPAYEKEKPRPGYVVWETRIHENRVRQLPMDHLSCGSTRE
jgi:hypothetical protein